MSSAATHGAAVRTAGPGTGVSHFFTESECRDIARRLADFARGGGTTTATIHSHWRGGVRWARNQISMSCDLRTNVVLLTRTINGASNPPVEVNDVSDAGLVAALRRAERLLETRAEQGVNVMTSVESMPKTDQFSDATFALDAETRAAAARELVRSAAAAGMLSAGYAEVSAHSMALVDSDGRIRYQPYTQARYSVTVRDPGGAGSGWAGDSHWDWAKLDAPTLSRVALEKCLRSRDPVRLEPGRYTTILEPQAVADFVGSLFYGSEDVGMDRSLTETPDGGKLPFNKRRGFAKLGERVVDERISISTDPADPELAYPPFWLTWDRVYHAAEWITNGVLTNLAYDHQYALQRLGRNTGLPNPGGFRMRVTGPTQTVEAMVAGTRRGLLVTRLTDVMRLHLKSTLVRGYTRDGLWLVEDGKISKPVKNLVFTEAILGALNRVEALGEPRRTFHPQGDTLFAVPHPVIVPALKINDFSFTSLTDAV